MVLLCRVKRNESQGPQHLLWKNHLRKGEIMKDYEDSIRFIHNGKEYHFQTKANPLNGNQMWWFGSGSMFAGTVKTAKTIARNIRKNAEVIE